MWNWNSGKKTAGESDLRVIDKEVVLKIERRDPRMGKQRCACVKATKKERSHVWKKN